MNLKSLPLYSKDPDFGQTFYMVDPNFRTAAQGWTQSDMTGPLDLYNQRNPGYVFYGAGVSGQTGITNSYATDAAAFQAAIDASPDKATSAPAASFHPGRGSPSDRADAPMPNTGTSRATGVTVAAGWRASSQFHTP